jgi:hypothetical protein
MSEKLLALAKSFLNSEISAEIFSDGFISQWKQERDDKLKISDEPQVSEALSSIFCLADMFNPNDDCENYELDDVKLKFEILKIFKSMDI